MTDREEPLFNICDEIYSLSELRKIFFRSETKVNQFADVTVERSFMEPDGDGHLRSVCRSKTITTDDPAQIEALMCYHRMLMSVTHARTIQPGERDGYSKNPTWAGRRIMRFVGTKELAERYPEAAPTTDPWGADEAHLVEQWQYEVAEDNTRLGYWAWVKAQKELNQYG